MKKKNINRCQTQGAGQQEIAAINLQIREHQAAIKQLRAHKREILEKHKKRRRCLWDKDTPMRKLVSSTFEPQFVAMMKEWEKHTTQDIQPMKTYHFHFVQERKWYAIRALALMLMRDKHTFKVSTSELCRYLSIHSNLGTPEAIRKAIQRVKAQILLES